MVPIRLQFQHRQKLIVLMKYNIISGENTTLLLIFIYSHTHWRCKIKPPTKYQEIHLHAQLHPRNGCIHLAHISLKDNSCAHKSTTRSHTNLRTMKTLFDVVCAHFQTLNRYTECSFSKVDWSGKWFVWCLGQYCIFTVRPKTMINHWFNQKYSEKIWWKCCGLFIVQVFTIYSSKTS